MNHYVTFNCDNSFVFIGSSTDHTTKLQTAKLEAANPQSDDDRNHISGMIW